MPNQTDNEYTVSCRDGRGDAIETVYEGPDYSKAYQLGAAHMTECAHPNGHETVCTRKDYYGFVHVSGRWGRVRSNGVQA